MCDLKGFLLVKNYYKEENVNEFKKKLENLEDLLF